MERTAAHDIESAGFATIARPDRTVSDDTPLLIAPVLTAPVLTAPPPPPAPPPAEPPPPGVVDTVSPDLDTGVVDTVSVDGDAGIVDTGRGWGIRAVQPAPLRAWDVTPPPAPSAPFAAAPGGWSPLGAGSIPVRRRSGSRLAGLLVVGLAMAGLGFYGTRVGFGNLFGSGQPLSQPASIGSLALMQTGAAGQATAAMTEGLKKGAGQSVAGVYGAGGVPQLIFVATNAGSPESTQQILNDLATRGISFGSAGTVTQKLGGQDFVCGTWTDAQIGSAVLCVWNDKNIDAVVLNLGGGDVQATVSLAAQARAAAER
jgi:hypothetical protein